MISIPASDSYARHVLARNPLDLAARAAVALELVSGETGLSIVDLLEPNNAEPVATP